MIATKGKKEKYHTTFYSFPSLLLLKTERAIKALIMALVLLF